MPSKEITLVGAGPFEPRHCAACGVGQCTQAPNSACRVFSPAPIGSHTFSQVGITGGIDSCVFYEPEVMAGALLDELDKIGQPKVDFAATQAVSEQQLVGMITFLNAAGLGMHAERLLSLITGNVAEAKLPEELIEKLWSGGEATALEVLEVIVTSSPDQTSIFATRSELPLTSTPEALHQVAVPQSMPGEPTMSDFFSAEFDPKSAAIDAWIAQSLRAFPSFAEVSRGDKFGAADTILATFANNGNKPFFFNGKEITINLIYDYNDLEFGIENRIKEGDFVLDIVDNTSPEFLNAQIVLQLLILSKSIGKDWGPVLRTLNRAVVDDFYAHINDLQYLVEFIFDSTEPLMNHTSPKLEYA